jgi:hypothetical protein
MELVMERNQKEYNKLKIGAIKGTNPNDERAVGIRNVG